MRLFLPEILVSFLVDTSKESELILSSRQLAKSFRYQGIWIESTCHMRFVRQSHQCIDFCRIQLAVLMPLGSTLRLWIHIIFSLVQTKKLDYHGPNLTDSMILGSMI